MRVFVWFVAPSLLAFQMANKTMIMSLSESAFCLVDSLNTTFFTMV